MSEIRVDVDLEHPPPVVWRAFTEVHLLTDWLPATRFMVRENGSFTFQAAGLAGLEDPIEGELVTVEAPHRLVMRRQADNLHTAVAPVPPDAAPAVVRAEPLPPRRESALRRAWRWLAATHDWSADRRGQAVAAAAAGLLLLAMAALLIGKATALHPAAPPQTGGESPGPTPAALPAASGHPSRTAPEPIVAATTRSPAPASRLVGGAELTAGYKTENLTLTSYRVTITISNTGPATATGWTLAIVLPLLDLTVRNVTGATMTRSDLRMLLTPVDATRTVRPGAQATVAFEVEGLGVRNEPLTCTIDGRNCTGIPG